MFDLVKLKVNGFRGFVGEREFLFDHPVMLLLGENHRGKSSTLNAIEWCLFGDDCVGSKTGIRERIGWEIANRYATPEGVSVTVEFASTDGTYTVRRERSVGKGRGTRKVTVRLPDNSEVQDTEAEWLISALFRSSFQDFMTTVYQHQEAIRAILTSEPRDRNDAIDRLLGLSSYREVLNGIAEAKLERMLKDMEVKVEGFRKAREQAVRTLDSLIRDEKEKAVDGGIAEDEITEQGALRRASCIAGAVESLARQFGASDHKIAMPASFGDIAGFRAAISDCIDSLWAQAPDVLRQEALVKEQRELVGLRGDYEAAVAEEKKKQSDREDAVAKLGDEASLEQATKAQQKAISRLDGQIREIHAKANLVREAIQYLKEPGADAEEGKCPLCGTTVPDLLSHLQQEWEANISEKVEQLDEERSRSQLELDSLQAHHSQLGKLQKKVELAHSARLALVNPIAKALGCQIRDRDDPLTLLCQRLSDIAKDIKSTGNAIASKRSSISRIHDQLGELAIIDEILIHDYKKTTVERIQQAREYTELEDTLNEASQFAEDITAIRSVLAEASREEADSKISAAGVALDKYFCSIAKHPAIPGLVMEVDGGARGGLNTYSFMSKDGTDPARILSQGDLNCLALSLFLGLSEATGDSQRFAFLLFDDPTQSLGSDMKADLVEALRDIASHRKLIIATPDTEFSDLLMAGITKSKATYSFVDWTPDDGPQIVRTG